MISNPSPSDAFSLIHPNAAGIDIASEFHYVAVPYDRSNSPVRKFGSFTSDLHDMARWLRECRIDTVAMESTGVYWLQAYLILEEYGFDVYLVNARHVKNVTGRKSDVSDCQWIQQLHTYGLLRKSFQPEDLTRELRTYVRQRKSLTQQCSTQIQLMQKAFDQMNIKLHNVIADITGKSGMLIIQAILSGERDAKKLSLLGDSKLKASPQTLENSLQGIWREDNLFELKQAYDLYHVFREKITECDNRIQCVFGKMTSNNNKNKSCETSRTDSANSSSKRKANGKNKFNFNATQYLNQITEVDLTQIFGVSELTVTEIMSETGTDLSAWKSEKCFTSWLNLAPNTKTSAGKKIKGRPVKKTNKAGQAFLMAASTLKAANNQFGEFYRRIKAKSGAPVAIKATARKLAVIYYKMITSKVQFAPMPVEEYNQYFKERKLKYILKQADALGFTIAMNQDVS